MPRGTHSIQWVYSWLQRLRSLRHRFWYDLSERVRWSRGAYRDAPVLELPALANDQAQRISALRTRYQVKFERHMNRATSLNNYEYLDLLDRAWDAGALPRPHGGSVCDVGSASFWYAAALDAFFQPRELIGVDVEGHRLFKDFRSRIDYAAGYLHEMPHARFIVADYAALDLPVDLVTAWFPFLTATAILAWRLPLSMLSPQRLFARVFANLRPQGLFVMVNHGNEEARLAQALCTAVGLQPLLHFDEPGVLSAHRPRPAVLSCWRRP